MNENRIHYLDNLRAIAMMLGVFLHAGFAMQSLQRDLVGN